MAFSMPPEENGKALVKRTGTAVHGLPTALSASQEYPAEFCNTLAMLWMTRRAYLLQTAVTQ
jgi:hypothetical protein